MVEVLMEAGPRGSSPGQLHTRRDAAANEQAALPFQLALILVNAHGPVADHGASMPAIAGIPHGADRRLTKGHREETIPASRTNRSSLMRVWP